MLTPRGSPFHEQDFSNPVQGDVLPDGSRIEDRVCRQGGALEYNGEDSDADLEAALDSEIAELNGVEDE